MRSKTNFWKRSMAALLSLVMVLAMVPAFNIAVEAEAAETDDTYISMPITIRDYAADGMLFEFNQVGATGTAIVGGTTMSVYVNPSTFNNSNYSGVCVFTNRTSQGNDVGVWWLDIYVNADGTINRLYKAGTAIADTTIPSGGMYIAVHSNSGYYSTLNQITDANKGNYKFTLSGSTLTMENSSVPAGTYNQADTAGFSMLATGTADYINNLTANSIAGTTLIQNGSWGLTTDPNPVKTTLNSGASQDVYGAWIRTDLVQPYLVNGEMVYTEAAVKYIAEYMQQIMAVPWQNNNGTYNTYFVTGHKLDELGGKDLAAKIREEVTGGLGTYASAKAKFDAGNLNEYTQIETWYDAAYFLLHNIFNDNTGYGKTVDAYKNLNLVQTTNSDGEICYVFNSGYDGAVYDYENGEIYNTQTTTVTGAYANGATGPTYVRGNLLPAARFDPLGLSGAGAELGYGMSGDTYGDMVGANDADWADYYDETNYHMSLEGRAQFIYYEDSDLYFTFTGDDDVYLFINGVRVLDVGAAHSISKVKISLNDVAELCSLQDGKAYDFDFFYMERHGTAANFGIETNIRIVDPAMTTTKEGFQNGISTGYNGYVDPLTPVYYSFGLKNNGEAPIEDLTFTDDDIGVYLSKDNITVNDETEENWKYVGAIFYNADGSTRSHIDGIAKEDMKKLLDDGLEVGEEIIFYGFRYTIPEAVWEAGNGTFPNTVYTTAVGVGDNAGQTLNGIADWKVQEREYSFKDYHVYEWTGHSVTLTKDELLQPLVDAKVPGLNKDNATIAVSSASGTTTGVNVNTKAELNKDGSITYTGTQTGADTFYYKVTQGTVTAVIGVAVYSYDVADNTYVLDYGLSVELNGDDFGLMVNDTLQLADNPKATTAKVTGIQNATSNYGDFTWDDPSLKYTPDAIINNTDSVRANVQVLEDGYTELTKFTGVAMYETVTTAPANVVYYEENFPGITYVNEGENQWAHYETVDDEGNTVAGTEQSADQDSNYGSDPNYEADKVGTIVSGDSVGTVIDSTTFNLDTSDLDSLQAAGIEALNKYLGLGGSDSNGTVNELVVNTTADVMYFEFTGTGFEILSRTTVGQYAVINVTVQKKNADGTYTVVRQKPVITESKGGDLYQVPIISITGLDKAEYRIVVKAAGSTDTVNRVLYIDGVRIYGPLSDEEALEYYNPEEYQAEFLEIKQLIEEGKTIYADASDTDDDLQLVTGTTLVEDQSGDFLLTTIGRVEEYMQIGPNNEIYLDGNAAYGMIAFFLTPDEDTPEAARTIEIGAHRKSDSTMDDNGYVTMTYGSTAEDIIDGTNSYDIASGTEMYYTIDVDNLIMDDDGRYLVMIGTNGSEWFGTTLALTSLKLSGYEISFVQAALLAADKEGTLSNFSVMREVKTIRNAVWAGIEEEVDTTPVNENLVINSASLKASSVVSGKVATLTVKATDIATSIVVTDAEGNVVEATKLTAKTSGGVTTFTFIWTVTGSRGDVLDYTVRVLDAVGLASVNTETVSVTIK